MTFRLVPLLALLRMKVLSVTAILLAFPLIKVSLASLSTVDNGILGQPLVECGNEFIRFSIKTVKPFRGKVFVKGQHGKKDCSRSYSETDSVISTHSEETQINSKQPGKISLEGNAPSIISHSGIAPTITKAVQSLHDYSSQTNLKRAATITTLDENSRASSDAEQVLLSNKAMRTLTPATRSFPAVNKLTETKRSTEESKNIATISDSKRTGSLNVFSRTESESVDKRLKSNDRTRISHLDMSLEGSRNNDSSAVTSRITTEDMAHLKNIAFESSLFVTTESNHFNDAKQNKKSLFEEFDRQLDDVVQEKRSSIVPSDTSEFVESDQADQQSTAYRTKSHTVEQMNSNFEHEYSGSSMFATASVTTTNPQCPPCPICRDAAEIDRRKSHAATEGAADLLIKLGTCNAKYEDQIEPQAVIVSLTVIVSFHQNLLTKLDRAFRIQCTYMESSKIINADMSVSMPPSTEIGSEISPPKCYYIVTGPSGKAITNARVGELVEHQWICNSPFKGVYAMLVRNCYAESDGNFRVPVIDEHGCTLDSYILPNLQYASDGLSVKTRATVFKFPDSSKIGFQCDVIICLQDQQDCRSTTPPKCAYGLRKRRELFNVSKRSLVLRTPTIKITDLDDAIQELAPEQFILDPPLSSKSSRYCLTITRFAFIIASTTFLVTTTAILLGAFIISSNSQQIYKLPVSKL
uniref:ZP domain-containing protein n=1 Tax=Setaria digitata TaxID=48799 RepID=A0A915PX41_9BILA